jgi:hypothetical protein
MWDSNDCGFCNAWMGDDGILYVDRADPFSAGLDQIFGAVRNFDVASGSW